MKVLIIVISSYILKDSKNIDKIFLYSDMKNKIKRATKYYEIDKIEASTVISKVNK